MNRFKLQNETQQSLSRLKYSSLMFYTARLWSSVMFFFVYCCHTAKILFCIPIYSIYCTELSMFTGRSTSLSLSLSISSLSHVSERQAEMRQKHVSFIQTPVYQSNIASSDVVIVFILSRTRTSSAPPPLPPLRLAQAALLHRVALMFCCVSNLWVWMLTSTVVSVQGKTHLSGLNLQGIALQYHSAPKQQAAFTTLF